MRMLFFSSLVDNLASYCHVCYVCLPKATVGYGSVGLLGLRKPNRSEGRRQGCGWYDGGGILGPGLSDEFVCHGRAFARITVLASVVT